MAPKAKNPQQKTGSKLSKTSSKKPVLSSTNGIKVKTTSQEPEASKEVFHSEGRAYEKVENDCLVGFVPLAQPKDSPIYFTWKGAKFDPVMWSEIINFFEWSQKTSKAEALVLLYYNTRSHEWRAWAPPQRGIGMTVSAKDDHPEYDKQRKELFGGGGWRQYGTIHHHCTSKAFQSGTDKHDEEDRDGIHITIGHVGSKEANYDFHARTTFAGGAYDAPFWAWFSLPDWASQAPDRIHEIILRNHYLDKDAILDTEVPKLWKSNYNIASPTLNWSSGVHTEKKEAEEDAMEMSEEEFHLLVEIYAVLQEHNTTPDEWLRSQGQGWFDATPKMRRSCSKVNISLITDTSVKNLIEAKRVLRKGEAYEEALPPQSRLSAN